MSQLMPGATNTQSLLASSMSMPSASVKLAW